MCVHTYVCNAPFELSQEYEHSELLCVYIHALLNCFCRNVTNFSTSLLPLRNACQNCYHWCSVQEDLGAEPEDNWRAVNWEDSQLGLQRCTALGHSEPVPVCTDTNILAHHTPHLYLSTFLDLCTPDHTHSLSLSPSLPLPPLPQSFMFVPQVVIAPTHAIVVTLLLWFYVDLGPSCLPGMGLLLLQMPLQYLVGRLYAKLRWVGCGGVWTAPGEVTEARCQTF